MFTTKIKILLLAGIMMAPQVVAQQLSIRAEDNRQPFIYSINGYEIRLQGNKATFLNRDTTISGVPISISHNQEFLGFTQRVPESMVKYYSPEGKALHNVKGLSLDASDESTNIYIADNGRLAVRKNIASFEFYSSTGNLIQAVSNSTQSELGEAISEYASDPYVSTTVVYNPRINFKGRSGSQIRRFNGQRLEYIWDDYSRLLSLVEVSPSGRMVALASSKEGEDDQVEILDRYGNKLRMYDTRDPIEAISFSDDDQYVMLRSQNRVVVYDITRDKRVGSSSFRGYPLLFASYIPEDELIVGITGEWDSSTEIVNHLEVRGVHLGKRSIATSEFEGSAVTRNAAVPWTIERLGRYRYRVTGTNRDLVIRGRY